MRTSCALTAQLVRMEEGERGSFLNEKYKKRGDVYELEWTLFAVVVLL